MSNIVLMLKNIVDFYLPRPIAKRRFRLKLVTNKYIYCHYAICQILIKKFLSKKGFEPSCVNNDLIVLTN
jgi:hypothetical protein